MTDPKIAVIVPIHNRIGYTLKFLESMSLVDYSNYEIIIIDDGSTDGSSEIITKKYPDVTLLKGDGDYWWTKSINTGVSYALKNNSDYILTLNNDVEVDKNIIKQLVKCSLENPNAIVGAKVLDRRDEQKVFFGGGKMDWIFPPHFNVLPYGNNDNEHYSRIREVDFLAGMGCLIPANVFKQIGLYNEEFLPQYFADGEFTLRAQKRGFKLLFCPDAKVLNNVESISWSFPEKITLNSLKQILFHKGSCYYLKATKYVYFTYWSKPLGVVAFSLLYLKCAAGIFLSILPGGKSIIKLFRKDSKTYPESLILSNDKNND